MLAMRLLDPNLPSNWTQIHDYVLLDNSNISQGVAATFSISARYIRIRLYNDGRYGDTGYTELYNFKLFGSAGDNFADSALSGVKIGTSAANGINTTNDYFGPSAYSLSMATGVSWTAVGALYTAGSNTNSIDRSSKNNTSASTFTGAGSATSPFCIVIDLGQSRIITSARYYQTFSDGKTTHAALDYAPNATSVPTRF